MMYTKDQNYAQMTLTLHEAEELENLIWRALNTYPYTEARDRWSDGIFPIEATYNPHTKPK